MGNETGFEPNLNTTEGTSVQQATEHKSGGAFHQPRGDENLVEQANLKLCVSF